MSTESLGELAAELIACRRCRRLVEWREHVAANKRAAFVGDEYWGKPVPGFGDPDARLVVIGLAPAAHGANRTGRMFTGDRSGEWLYRALHRAGFASQASSTDVGDGMVLDDAWITAPVRCVPPKNRPTPAERDNCASWFNAELDLLEKAQVFVALGEFGYRSTWRYLSGRQGEEKRPKFTHGLELDLGKITLLTSYHVSQQNTFTGRLTEGMLDDVFTTAARLLSTNTN